MVRKGTPIIHKYLGQNDMHKKGAFIILNALLGFANIPHISYIYPTYPLNALRMRCVLS